MQHPQSNHAGSHDDGAHDEQADPAVEPGHVEDRIRVEAVVAEALLDPEPVRDGDARADAGGGQGADLGRGRKEEEVDEHDGRGHEVEAEVGEDVERGRDLGEHECRVDLRAWSEGWRGCAWGVPRAGPSRACLSGSPAASSLRRACS